MEISALEDTRSLIKEAVQRLNLGHNGINFITELMGFKCRFSEDIIVPFPDPNHAGETKLESFKMVRVIHRGFEERWPSGGGERLLPTVDIEPMENLAMEMTIKFALMKCRFKGAKGGIALDPHKYTRQQLHPIIDKKVEALYERKIIGPFADRWAPDVNTDGEIMDWAAERYGYLMRLAGTPDPFYKGVATGKPPLSGGIPFRTQATSVGLHYALQVLCREMQISLPDCPTTAINGFGKVGLPFAEWAAELSNMKVNAVSNVDDHDKFGGVYKPDGLPVDELIRFANAYPRGSIADFADVCHGMRIDNRLDFISLPVDVFVPAALERDITETEAELLKCGVLLEGANSPTTGNASKIARARGIFIGPDVFTNSGGGLVSTFEHAHSTGKVYSYADTPVPTTDDDSVHAALRRYIFENGRELAALARGAGIDLRLAAYMLALKRLYPYFLTKRRLT